MNKLEELTKIIKKAEDEYRKQREPEVIFFRGDEYYDSERKAIATAIREAGYEKPCTCAPIRGTYIDINCPHHGNLPSVSKKVKLCPECGYQMTPSVCTKCGYVEPYIPPPCIGSFNRRVKP